MTGCRLRKRVQLYLDGWMEASEAGRFEAHLRNCPDCQGELIDLEEAASSALEIVDHAPDPGYWDNFSNRLFNRIISRNASPYESRKGSSKKLRLKIGSYAVAISTVAVVILLIVGYMTRSPLNPDVPAGLDQSAAVNSAVAKDAPNEDAADVQQAVPEKIEPEKRYLTDQGPMTPSDAAPGSTPGSRAQATGELIEDDQEGEDLVMEADGRFRARFRDAIRRGPANLSLDGDNSFLDRLMSVYDNRSSNDYRLDQETAVKAILSGYAPWIAAGADQRSPGVSVNGSIPGVAGRAYRVLPEMSERDELARYMIELQIMRAK